MVMVAGTTIWLLISLAFMLLALEVPAHLIRVGVAILCIDFVFLVIAANTAECTGGPCVGEQYITEAAPLPEAILTYVIPGSAAAFTLCLVAYGLLRHRGAKV